MLLIRGKIAKLYGCITSVTLDSLVDCSRFTIREKGRDKVVANKKKIIHSEHAIMIRSVIKWLLCRRTKMQPVNGKKEPNRRKFRTWNSLKNFGVWVIWS